LATKTQVAKLAAKQGAEFITGYTSTDEFYAEVILPQGLIWDNYYGDLGQIYQEKDRKETMAQFWDSIIAVIDSPVIAERTE
jgi:hypothetical protein